MKTMKRTNKYPAMSIVQNFVLYTYCIINISSMIKILYGLTFRFLADIHSNTGHDQIVWWLCTVIVLWWLQMQNDASIIIQHIHSQQCQIKFLCLWKFIFPVIILGWLWYVTIMLRPWKWVWSYFIPVMCYFMDERSLLWGCVSVFVWLLSYYKCSKWNLTCVLPQY